MRRNREGRRNADRVAGIEKSFATPDGGQLQVLRGIDAEIADEEFVVLIGASGCGKSTLLNVVAGLIEPSAGTVLLDGEPVTGPGRDRGMVFQQDAILMWRSVLRNVEYGLELRRVPRAERRRIAEEHLRLVGLERFADFFPKDLSAACASAFRSRRYSPTIPRSC